MSEEKGFDILLPALEKLKGPWQFLALGSGPYKEKIESWASQHGFSKRVRVTLVKHDEVAAHLNAMDMLVAPSQTRSNWMEQFGRMLIEGFACGLPVIGSDSGEIPYVIGETGLIVGETDIPGWTAAIQKLLESPTERERLGQAGLEKFHANYSSLSVEKKYYDYYQRLMAEG